MSLLETANEFCNLKLHWQLLENKSGNTIYCVASY